MKRALMLVVLAACGPTSRPVTAVGMRAAVLGLDVSTFDRSRLAALERGTVATGAPEHDVYLARGQPIVWWQTASEGGPCKVFVQASLQDASLADLSVTTCGGTVAQVAPIQPALPCWRLAGVAPRIAAESAFFDGLPLERQWQLVAGILRRGQSSREIAIALGQPHNRGLEEREDGVRADEQVFLDSSGDAYGLRVTLVDDRVVGWKVPSERRLTPEAEQRRLTAIEQRLTAKLTELEQRSIQQHAETMAQFDQVMRNQDSMLANLSTQPPWPYKDVLTEVAPSAPPSGPPASPPDARTDRSTRPLPPGGIKATFEKKELPWGKRCKEGSDECAPGACIKLTDDSRPMCTRWCKVRGEVCAPGYVCGYETAYVGNQAVDRGIMACRPVTAN